MSRTIEVIGTAVGFFITDEETFSALVPSVDEAHVVVEAEARAAQRNGDPIPTVTALQEVLEAWASQSTDKSLRLQYHVKKPS